MEVLLRYILLYVLSVGGFLNCVGFVVFFGLIVVFVSIFWMIYYGCYVGSRSCLELLEFFLVGVCIVCFIFGFCWWSGI